MALWKPQRNRKRASRLKRQERANKKRKMGLEKVYTKKKMQELRFVCGICLDAPKRLEVYRDTQTNFTRYVFKCHGDQLSFRYSDEQFVKFPGAGEPRHMREYLDSLWFLPDRVFSPEDSQAIGLLNQTMETKDSDVAELQVLIDLLLGQHWDLTRIWRACKLLLTYTPVIDAGQTFRFVTENAAQDVSLKFVDVGSGSMELQLTSGSQTVPIGRVAFYGEYIHPQQPNPNTQGAAAPDDRDAMGYAVHPAAQGDVVDIELPGQVTVSDVADIALEALSPQQRFGRCRHFRLVERDGWWQCLDCSIVPYDHPENWRISEVRNAEGESIVTYQPCQAGGYPAAEIEHEWHYRQGAAPGDQECHICWIIRNEPYNCTHRWIAHTDRMGGQCERCGAYRD